MKKIKIVFFAFFLVCLILVLAVGGVLYYFYSHPHAVKPFIEKTLSQATKSTLTMKSLSYSVKPLKVHMQGILFTPRNGEGFSLAVPELIADFSLEGAFGERTLRLKLLKIKNFSLEISRAPQLAGIERKGRESTWFKGALERLITFFLFKDIRFESADLENGKINAQFKDWVFQLGSLRAKVDSDQRIDLYGTAHFRSLDKNITFSTLSFHINTAHAISFIDPKITCRVAVNKANLKSPDMKISAIDMKATLNYTHKRRELIFESAELHGAKLDHKLKQVGKSPLSDLHVKTAGSFNLREKRLNLSPVGVTAGDVGRMDGNLTFRPGEKGEMTIENLKAEVIPEKIRRFLPRPLKKTLSPFALAGTVTIQGRIKGLRNKEKWNWHYDLKSQLQENALSYQGKQVGLAGKITGTIQTRGSLPDVTFSADLVTRETAIQGKGFEIEPFQAVLSLSGTDRRIRIDNLRTHIPLTKVNFRSRDFKIRDINMRIQKGSLDTQKRTLILQEIQFDCSWIKNLELSMKAEAERFDISLRGREIGLFQLMRTFKILPPGWQVKGHDSIQLTAVQRKSRGWSLTSEVKFEGLQYENDDGSAMGEKLTLDANIQAQFKRDDPFVTVKALLEADTGEVLHDRFYFDLQKNPFFSSWEGRYRISGQSMEILNLRVGLKNLIALNAKGKCSLKNRDPVFRISVHVPQAEVGPVFQQFILEPFQTEKPVLTTLSFGGNISGNLDIHGNRHDWWAKGRLSWKNGIFLLDGDHFSFKGIDLDLPVWHQPLLKGDREKALAGRLSIRSMTAPLLPEQSLNMQLSVNPDHLTVQSETGLQVPGGTVQIGPVEISNFFGSSPRLKTHLALDAVDVEPFLNRIWARPVQGTVSGKLAPVVMNENGIRTSGELKIRAFNGEITLSRIGVSEVFTPSPIIRLNALIKDLNLYDLTFDTSFGKIEGILKGYVEGLEIANGQPQGFDLLLETVRRKNSPQRISVRAVDNIAQIGGAQSPFMGVAGIFTSLFKEFPYKKIGVQASLKNDIFKINGTIKEGGKEYFVKKGLFAGVDIINHNPDNRINFKDMVKRIKRIRSGGRGPVIR